MRRRVSLGGWPAFGIDESPDRPLRSVDAEISADRVGAIVIRFADDLVRVEAPLALRLDETEQGAQRGLDIEPARGTRRLRFRVAALPGQLDGVAPGEL